MGEPSGDAPGEEVGEAFAPSPTVTASGDNARAGEAGLVFDLHRPLHFGEDLRAVFAGTVADHDAH